MKSGDFLEHYTSLFPTAEINNTFYSLPKEETLVNWKEKTPQNFHFSVKASRYITHMKKLKDPEDTLPPLLKGIEPLASKIPVILFQLPPKWKYNRERFSDFTEQLTRDYRYIFEFRDPSWINDEILTLLEERNMSFCIYELSGYLSPKHVTSDLVYIRLHGPGSAYRGRYSKKTLSGWAGAIHQWAEEGRDVYCYFDNDEKGYAPQNALELKKMLERKDEREN
jgi:uncharacterized protein YecE (DUF72 family)